MSRQHYDADGDSEWACGGDGDCEAVESEPDCVEGLGHAWTSRGEGGCDMNPGVWSLGGTTYQFSSRCRYCGTRRVEIQHGGQRNPGECDSVRYEDGGRDEEAIADGLRAQRRRSAARRRYASAMARALSADTRASLYAAWWTGPVYERYTAARAVLGRAVRDATCRRIVERLYRTSAGIEVR